MAETAAYRPPKVGSAQIRLLEKLSNACAVSGDEREVRKIVLEEVKPYADDVQIDALGNVLVVRRARQTGAHKPLRVMLDAHMDEVGMMLIEEDGAGYYRIATIGGVDPRYLIGKPVWVGREHVPGVIGAKPIHLTTRDERKSPIALDALRIDVGAAGKVKLGDRATFATSFRRVGPSLWGKALDDRLGVGVLLEMLRNAPPHLDLLLSFSTQEEIGLRGAKVAAYTLSPDLAFAIDSTPAADLPTWDGLENTSPNTRLGAGPAIYVADGGLLSDPRLLRHVMSVGDEYAIPYQIRQPGSSGGTNAGAIHKQRAGIPSLSISTPARYAHTGVLLARLADWQNTIALVHAALTRLTPDVLAGERETW